MELAEVAGLAGLHGALAPLTATSRGLGELIAHALDAGCTRVLVGIGGSASTDGGLGLVQALGARVRDASGAEVGPGGAGAATAATLDLTGLHPGLAAARIEVACDVDNPLTGPEGAAAVYGPQKGADPDQVRQLDAALAHWADVVAAATGHDHRADPGAGAAGGVGFATVAILGATLRPGAQLMLDQLGFADALAGADLVVTGEGSLDEQTLRGKAPAAVAAAGRAAGVPVIAVAGRCLLDAAAAAGRRVRRRLHAARRGRHAAAGVRRGRRAAATDRRSDSGIGCPMPEPVFDRAFVAARAVVDGAERPCVVAVRDGRIAAVLDRPGEAESVAAREIVRLADGEVLLPGLVDTHVHINEPGRTEWEGFDTGTRAAAAGGVTTVIDMPLNSIPPTTTVDALAVKRECAAAQAHVDVGFWGGAVPGNVGELEGLHAAGVFGFKCFMVDSGVPEFPPLDPAGLADGDGRDRPASARCSSLMPRTPS